MAKGTNNAAARMAPVFETAIHKLRGERYVIDVRNLGLVGRGVEGDGLGRPDCAMRALY